MFLVITLLPSTYIKGRFKEENPCSGSQGSNKVVGISADAADACSTGQLAQRKCSVAKSRTKSCNSELVTLCGTKPHQALLMFTHEEPSLFSRIQRVPNIKTKPKK